MNSTNFQLTVGDKAKARCPDQGTCVQCGYISSQEVKRNVYSHRITHWYFSKNPNPRCARPACSWPVWTKGCHSWGSARVASIGKWWWLRCGDVDGDGVVIMIQIVQEDTCWPWDGRTYSEKRGSCDPPLPSPASCWQRQRKLTFACMIFFTVFSKTLALAHMPGPVYFSEKNASSPITDGGREETSSPLDCHEQASFSAIGRSQSTPISYSIGQMVTAHIRLSKCPWHLFAYTRPTSFIVRGWSKKTKLLLLD